MSDAAAKDSKGTQAYRWLIGIGVAALAWLSSQQLDRIGKIGDKVEEVDKRLIRVEGSVDSVKVTVDGAKSQVDVRFTDHQRQINNLEGRNSVQDRQLEELQRQQWQRRQ